MKNTIATIFLVGSTLALSACNTTGQGDIQTQPPYALERTAVHASAPVIAPAVAPTRVAPAERVFQRAQTK